MVRRCDTPPSGVPGVYGGSRVLTAPMPPETRETDRGQGAEAQSIAWGRQDEPDRAGRWLHCRRPAEPRRPITAHAHPSPLPNRVEQAWQLPDRLRSPVTPPPPPTQTRKLCLNPHAFAFDRHSEKRPVVHWAHNCGRHPAR